MAETVIGSAEPRKMMKIAPVSPTPNHKIEIGIQASGEIGRRICRNGLTARSPRRDQPSMRPAGTPTSTAET